MQKLKTLSKLEQSLLKFKGTEDEFNALFNGEAKRKKDEVNTTRKKFAPLVKSWQTFLSSEKFEWRLFGTLTAQGGLTSKQIHKHVAKWFEILVKRFEALHLQSNALTSEDLKVFWVAEANTKCPSHVISDRFHIHILIECNNNIFLDVYDQDKYRKYNSFDVAWQMTQGRKPFVWKTCPDTGAHFKSELSKFRVQIVPLEPHNSKDVSNELRANRIKYCAKYVAKDMIQYGFLTPEKVKRSYFDDSSQTWVSSSDYTYDNAVNYNLTK